jgi:hypothetical protein
MSSPDTVSEIAIEIGTVAVVPAVGTAAEIVR